MESVDVTIEAFAKAMKNVYIIVVSFADAAALAFQRLSEELALSYGTQHFPFIEDIQSLEEAMTCLADEYADITFTPEQKTKASYKRNVLLQNRWYKTQMKLTRKRTMKASRPQIVRRLP